MTETQSSSSDDQRLVQGIAGMFGNLSSPSNDRRRLPKRDRSPLRYNKPQFTESNFDPDIFKQLLRFCTPHTIFALANTCKHWRWMIKVNIGGERLTAMCENWGVNSLRYTIVAMQYNFYEHGLISLENYEFLRGRVGFRPSDFRGTCLSPLGVTADRSRLEKNAMIHVPWVRLAKSRKAGDSVPNVIGQVISLQPSYSMLKHILLKFASNPKLESHKLITLHEMIGTKIPASLIKLYYEEIGKRIVDCNVFATHNRYAVTGAYLDYLLAAQPVLQSLFPREYIRLLANILLYSVKEEAHVDKTITEFLKVYENLLPKDKFSWLPAFCTSYKSNLSDAQVSRLLPAFNDYWVCVELRQIPIFKTPLCSHQLMLLMLKSTNNAWAPRYFLWLLSDREWYNGRALTARLLKYLRTDSVTIPWILGSLTSYLPILQASERSEAEQNLADFFRRMMDKNTWRDESCWRSDDGIIKKFLDTATPGSQRSLVGYMYYPGAVSRMFLNYDFDYESTDPNVVKYNFLKMRASVMQIE